MLAAGLGPVLWPRWPEGCPGRKNKHHLVALNLSPRSKGLGASDREGGELLEAAVSCCYLTAEAFN